MIHQWNKKREEIDAYLKPKSEMVAEDGYFVGEKDGNENAEGFGILRWEWDAYEKYIGRFELDQRQGKGLFHFEPHQWYKGDFEQNKFTGQAEYFHKKVEMYCFYMGGFKDYRKHGQGSETCIQDHFFEDEQTLIQAHLAQTGKRYMFFNGEYNEGKFTGKFRVTNPFGQRGSADLKDDVLLRSRTYQHDATLLYVEYDDQYRFDGKHAYKYPNGDHEILNFKNGDMHGVRTSKMEDTFEVEHFAKNRSEGFAVFKKENSMEVNEFKDGKMHGRALKKSYDKWSATEYEKGEETKSKEDVTEQINEADFDKYLAEAEEWNDEWNYELHIPLWEKGWRDPHAEDDLMFAETQHGGVIRKDPNQQ